MTTNQNTLDPTSRNKHEINTPRACGWEKVKKLKLRTNCWVRIRITQRNWVYLSNFVDLWDRLSLDCLGFTMIGLDDRLAFESPFWFVFLCLASFECEERSITNQERTSRWIQPVVVSNERSSTDISYLSIQVNPHLAVARIDISSRSRWYF